VEGRVSGIDVTTRPGHRREAGMKRWVGLGVIADNIVNIGRAMQKQEAP
jgi:hypothetical protein